MSGILIRRETSFTSVMSRETISRRSISRPTVDIAASASDDSIIIVSVYQSVTLNFNDNFFINIHL